jgi:hypothetical protein
MRAAPRRAIGSLQLRHPARCARPRAAGPCAHLARRAQAALFAASRRPKSPSRVASFLCRGILPVGRMQSRRTAWKRHTRGHSPVPGQEESPMFGRTFRAALLLIVSQLASGCCCCERPFFWRKYQGGCCCEQPCTTCCGSPAVPYGAMAPHGVPVYTGAPVALPAAPAGPMVSPPVDRMQPISSTALSR